MTSVESSEQYIIKDDSSGISKVEPRVYSSLWCSRSFCFLWDGDNYLKIIGIGHNEILVTGANHDFDDDTISSKFIDTLKCLDRKHIIDGVKKYVGYELLV